jgi:hypothetical protein
MFIACLALNEARSVGAIGLHVVWAAKPQEKLWRATLIANSVKTTTSLWEIPTNIFRWLPAWAR